MTYFGLASDPDDRCRDTDSPASWKGSRLYSHVKEVFKLGLAEIFKTLACGNVAGWWWALIKIQIMNLWFECLNYQYYIYFYMPRFSRYLVLELATSLWLELGLDSR